MSVDGVVEASHAVESNALVVACEPFAVAWDGTAAAEASVQGLVETPSVRWADEHLEAWGDEVVLGAGPWGDRLAGAGRILA